jgi:hypothetical protein
MRKSFRYGRHGLPLVGILSCLVVGPSARADDHGSILDQLHHISTITSTVPANGDVNPYGMAMVQLSEGRLRRGHILISNFNNSANLQGTGTTIVDVAPDGSFGVFAQIDPDALPGQCPGGVGLTTALVVLRTGWVIVGSLPTSDGTSATAQAGCLIVLDRHGTPVETFSGPPINGPWDMTALNRGSEATLFVSNVLNGTVAGNGKVVDMGTVVRIDLDVSEMKMPAVKAITVVASGLSQRTDPAALVIGPTGLALSPGCMSASAASCSMDGDAETGRVLYIADTLNSRIAVVHHPLTRTRSAGTGETLTVGGSLNGPLGLAVARNGHILTVNANDGFITEIAPDGTQIAKKLLDNTGGPPPGVGTLFGLLPVGNDRIYFVDDGSNTLNLLR